MNRLHLIFISAATAAMMLFCATYVRAQMPANALTDFRTYIRDMTTLSGTFTQEVRDKNGRVRQQSTGNFVLARPGKFRFIYDKPYKQTIVSDGNTVWLYDEDLNQVTIKKITTAISEQPLALLLDPSAVDKTFTLKTLEPKGTMGFVSAVPKNADAAFNNLQIAMVSLEPKELSWHDALQNGNVIRFGELSKNVTVSADAFSFTPPKNVDILRQ